MSGAKVLLALSVVVVVGLIFVLRWGGDEPAPPSVIGEATRPPPAKTQKPATAPVEEPTAKPVPAQISIDGVETNIVEVDLTNSPDFYSMLRQLGIEDVEERLGAWGAERGYPQLDDQGNPVLDQPYHQYDEATLRAFSDGGDMWAQQILADRLASTRPGEALELYREAAINGSLHAMTEMARLYRQLGVGGGANKLLDGDEASLQQAYALQDGPDSLAVTGYAWAAVAEKAGWDPLRGGMTASFVGAKLSDDQISSACEFAESLYGELATQRSARGLEDYDRTPPPVVFDPGATGGTACNNDVSDNLTGCKEVHVRVGDQVSRIWTCD